MKLVFDGIDDAVINEVIEARHAREVLAAEQAILVAMLMHHVVMVTPRVTRVVRTTPREPPRATKSASRAPLVV